MGKRYYYDSKGRYKGKSSSTFIADGKTYKMLGIMAVIAIAWNMIFGGSAEENSSNVTQENVPQEVETPAEWTVAPQTTIEVSMAAPSPQPQSTAEAPSQQTVHESTEEYWQREYVNGDPNCPRDIVAYHKSQCEAGDQQSCELAACGAE